MHPTPAANAQHPAPNAEALVELRAVSKRYGSVVALRDVSLAIAPGELVFVLGPSGAGKSTLLRIVGGYETPDSGFLGIGGRRMDDVPVHRRDIGMVFQSYALFPHMTVAENVGFGLRMRGVRDPERTDRVGWALSLVRLEGLGRRYPRQLSGGQQQRVALARAIAFRPTLLLLDEPLASLDRRLRDEMRLELRQLQRKLGITTIFVTHDQEESLTMADRVVVMHGGAVQQVAAPAELYNAPANPFVASFIGEMNVLRCAVLASDGADCEVRIGGAVARVRSSAGLSAGDRVTVCLRAERAGLEGTPPPARSPGRAGGGVNALTGQVRFSSYLGASTLYLVEVADGTLLKVSEPNSAGLARFAPGDSVTVSWPIEAAMVFQERPTPPRPSLAGRGAGG
jgi:ABC-type Fe3+/spermidine/putrescine transport system ATPase subunit